MPFQLEITSESKTRIYDVESALGERLKKVGENSVAYVTVGRSALCDIVLPVDKKTMSRFQGAITLNTKGELHYMEFNTALRTTIVIPNLGGVLAGTFPFRIEDKMQFVFGLPKGVTLTYVAPSAVVVDSAEKQAPASGGTGGGDATAAAAAPDSSNGLADVLTCSICFDITLSSHVVTGCGHSFCGNCLVRWILKSGSKMSCPSCRTPSVPSAPAAPVHALDQTIVHYAKNCANDAIRQTVLEHFSHRQIEGAAKSATTANEYPVKMSEKKATTRKRKTTGETAVAVVVAAA